MRGESTLTVTGVEAVRVPTRELDMADWDALREAYPGHRFEIQDGSLLVMAPPKTGHNQVVSRLFAWLIRHGVDENCLAVDVGLTTGVDSGRIPDLTVLHAPVSPHLNHVQPSMVALVVEVVSTGSKVSDHKVKPAEYAHAGVERFWVVDDPELLDAATVHRYVLADGAYRREAVSSLADLLASAPALDVS